MTILKSARFGVLTGLLLIAVIFRGPSIGAQNGVSPQVSPLRSTISTDAGKKEQLTITLKNADETPGKFSAVFMNFTAGEDETGQPKVTEDDNHQSGIKKWLSGPASVALNSNETREYTLTISVPPGTPAGTYYGLVLFSRQVAPPNEGLSPAVGSLIFINVGSVTQKLAIEEFNTTAIKVSPNGMANGDFVVRLKNVGNGYSVPKIKIEILEDNKSVIETLDINVNSGGILPESIRKYSADFSKQLEPPKSYSARLTVTAENGDSVTDEKVLVGTLPPKTAGSSSSSPSDSRPLLLIGLVVASLLLTLTGVLLAQRQHKKRQRSNGFSQDQLLTGALLHQDASGTLPSQDPQDSKLPSSTETTSRNQPQ